MAYPSFVENGDSIIARIRRPYLIPSPTFGYSSAAQSIGTRLVQDDSIRRSAPLRSCDGIDVAMTTTVEVKEALRRVGREDDSRIDLAEAALMLAAFDCPGAPVDTYRDHLGRLAVETAEAVSGCMRR